MKDKRREPVDYGAAMSHSPNPPAGLDLGPALNKLQCRSCGQEVSGLKCPKCDGEGGK